MFMLAGHFLVGIGIVVVFVIITLPITIPLALWLHLAECLDDPIQRKMLKANRQARRDYIKSLPPVDRAAFLWHEKRKLAYYHLPPFKPYKPGEWDDVVKAPDFFDHPYENLTWFENKTNPKEWEPPKWR
jgi:hypothetical protein